MSLKIEQQSEREKAIECMKALSRIEGYVFNVKDDASFLEGNLDYLVKYFDELLEELDR